MQDTHCASSGYTNTIGDNLALSSIAKITFFVGLSKKVIRRFRFLRLDVKALMYEGVLWRRTCKVIGYKVIGL